uniref:(northern house mosquito) hypothetical protein n=1 Tax=Culex pipiens TaxID=7175 RepID=A0A8D8B6Q4_CULPI
MYRNIQRNASSLRSSRIRNNKCFKGLALLADHAGRDPKTDRVGVDPAGLRGGPRLPGLDTGHARHPDRVLQRTGLEADRDLPAAGRHRAGLGPDADDRLAAAQGRLPGRHHAGDASLDQADALHVPGVPHDVRGVPRPGGGPWRLGTIAVQRAR